MEASVLLRSLVSTRVSHLAVCLSVIITMVAKDIVLKLFIFSFSSVNGSLVVPYPFILVVLVRYQSLALSLSLLSCLLSLISVNFLRLQFFSVSFLLAVFSLSSVKLCTRVANSKGSTSGQALHQVLVQRVIWLIPVQGQMPQLMATQILEIWGLARNLALIILLFHFLQCHSWEA